MIQTILHMSMVGAAAVMALFFLIWVIHLLLKNAGIVDVGWGLGFIILCAVYIFMGEGFNARNSLYFLMVTAWGLRISIFLIKRLAGDAHEDKRYQKIRQDWKDNLAIKFLLFFEFQAVLEVVLALPFIIVAVNPAPGLSGMEITAFSVWLFALIGETLSDQQLQDFKNKLSNKGKVCDIGFWRYSRHPNYFFEWLVWVGIGMYALASPGGWIGIISPAIMYYLMMHVSGVPLAEEQSLLTRGDAYRAYQAQTSVFFPLPKK